MAANTPDEIELATGVTLADRHELIASGALAIFNSGVDHDGRPMISPGQASKMAAIVVGRSLSAWARDICDAAFADATQLEREFQGMIGHICSEITQQKAIDRDRELSAVTTMMKMIDQPKR